MAKVRVASCSFSKVLVGWHALEGFAEGRGWNGLKRSPSKTQRVPRHPTDIIRSAPLSGPGHASRRNTEVFGNGMKVADGSPNLLRMVPRGTCGILTSMHFRAASMDLTSVRATDDLDAPHARPSSDATIDLAA